MSRMRIAYVINSLEGGGAASPVPAVTRILRDAGCEIAVFALARRDGRGLAAMLADGLEVKVCDTPADGHLAALRWLDRAIARYRPTHLWTSLTRATLLGQLIGLRRGLPVISWQHAAFLKSANLRLLRLMRRRSLLWIGDSASVTGLTAERLAIPPERLATWPIFFARTDLPQALPWKAGEPLRLGSLGRLHPIKGYDVLIAALAHMRAQGFAPPVPFEIVVAGDGAARTSLVAQAAGAGVESVRFAGFADRPADFLSGLHLYLQPSRSEGLCIAAHEAMLAGLPVIGSAAGEMAHSIVPGLTGALVRPGHPIALAEAMMALLRDPLMLRAMGRAGRKRVLDRFGETAFVAAGHAIIDRIEALSRAAG